MPALGPPYQRLRRGAACGLIPERDGAGKGARLAAERSSAFHAVHDQADDRRHDCAGDATAGRLAGAARRIRLWMTTRR